MLVSLRCSSYLYFVMCFHSHLGETGHLECVFDTLFLPPLLRTQHTQVPSAAQYLPEYHFRRVTMPPGCFASRDFSHALLPRSDELRMNSIRTFLGTTSRRSSRGWLDYTIAPALLYAPYFREFYL
jgi:hypothetical protein